MDKAIYGHSDPFEVFICFIFHNWLICGWHIFHHILVKNLRVNLFSDEFIQGPTTPSLWTGTNPQPVGNEAGKWQASA